MDPRGLDDVDAVVRDMLDAMRNALLQMVVGEPYRAVECLDAAKGAHRQLAVLFLGDHANEALAGRILFQVIEQRIEALSSLAKDSLNSAMTTAEVVASVARPLAPTRTECEPAPTQMPPLG